MILPQSRKKPRKCKFFAAMQEFLARKETVGLGCPFEIRQRSRWLQEPSAAAGVRRGTVGHCREAKSVGVRDQGKAFAAGRRPRSRCPAAIILIALAAVWITMGGDAWAGAAGKAKGAPMPFVLQTNAFSPGAAIDAKYTCSGANISPALSWSGVPEGTQSLALIVEDPDAPGGTFTHWVLYNLGPTETQLGESMPKTDRLPNGAQQGRNNFGRVGYGGPCPPPGKPHRYFFKLYALDRKLELKPGASKKEVEQTMQGHILGQAELMGKFQR